MVAGATAVGLAASPVIPVAAINLVYLIPVLEAASLYGLGAGVVASVASALAYNFFFTPPLHTLRIDDPGNVVTVLVLLGVALFTSRLAARLRTEAANAAASARQSDVLAGFAGQLVAAGDEASIGRILCAEVARLFAANALFLTTDGPALRLLAAVPDRCPPTGIDLAAAQEAMTLGKPAGRYSGTLTAADWQFHPLLAGETVLGVLGLARDDGRPAVDAAGRDLLDSLLAQAALALARKRLAAEMRDVARLRERDRLQGALLASVGHDLRTPLTTILAGTAALAQSAAPADLTATIDTAARQLDRYIANLLDMTRIEAGAIRLALEPIDLTDAVAAAVRALAGTLTGRRLDIAIAADLPLVRLDAQLFHHCLINLLDNAARHGGDTIVVAAAADDAGLMLSVTDNGPGLPPGSEGLVFDSFIRLAAAARGTGTGLGLAIVRAFAEAMGARIEARNAPGGGAVVAMRFPSALLIPAETTA